MNSIKLLKKLVSIPSYVDKTHDEHKIGNYILNYLKQFKFLNVKKQKIDDKRFNVIAKTKGQPQLLLAGHIDTVQPKRGWATNQFNATTIASKIFGLGTVDMKAGVAAILSSIASFDNIRGLTLLFYCDEEYSFQGMKKFISKTKKSQIGKLAIIPEPSQLKIWNAHRGVIEISFAIKGKTGHAANPASGKNAITGMNNLLNNK